MRKLFPAVAGLILAFGLAAVSVNATAVIPLGPSSSTQGVLFTGGSGDGSLGVQIGACPLSSSGCSTGPVTGSLGAGATVGGTIFLYGGFSLDADSLTASPSSGIGNWSLNGAANPDSFSVELSAFEGPCSNPFGPNTCTGVGSSGIGGSINWTSLVENKSGNFLTGTANYTSVTGFLANYIGSSGSASFTVQLSSLTCTGTETCSLTAISGELADPPTAFGTLSSGSFGGSGGGPSPTPEPGTLMLLGSGLLGLAPFVRRRFARA